MKTAIALPAALLALICLADGAQPAADSVIVPVGADLRNPATLVSVEFGDISHVSPWRIRRRHPRTGSERGGQLVTVRDALVALNGAIAADVEMPEHAFGFSSDGCLVSVCDIPLGSSLGDKTTGVRLSGHEEALVTHAIDAELLDKPVLDFTEIAFVLVEKSKGATDNSSTSGAKTGDTRTIVLPGGATMEMIWCGPGSFLMGSPKDEVGRFDDEPMHRVTLTKGFWMGKYEVTQAQWESVMGKNPSRFPGENRPVDNVSWDDCQKFVRSLNAALGDIARLPTEAEWEYACRAGSAQPVAGSGLLEEMAWYDANSGSRTHEVGHNKPNDWGFFDMHGNVLEWCSDWFSNQEGHAVDPQGPATGSFRVLRGGCWFFLARDCRSAYRLKRDPGIRNSIFGCRIVCSRLD